MTPRRQSRNLGVTSIYLQGPTSPRSDATNSPPRSERPIPTPTRAIIRGPSCACRSASMFRRPARAAVPSAERDPASATRCRATRKRQSTDVACEAVTGTGSSEQTDRVAERRRAVALARHFREFEGLSIKQIADRLGRSPATVKAYFYDPSNANKRPTNSPHAMPLGWRSSTSGRLGVLMLDRVAERRRAAQVARHYRDQEGLSIAEIARRLGRAEATIKTYLYDPTGEKARAVKARYRGVCRGCGAPTAPRNGKGDAYAYCKRCHPGAIAPQWTRERVREAMRAWQARYGAAPSSYDWSRTHARRRGGEALKRLHAGRMARTVHRHRSVRQLGGGPRRRLRRRLNARATMPLLHGPSLALGHLRTGAAKIAATLRPFVSSAAATRPSAPGDCWARGATATCACKPPRIGPPASTSTTLATAAKQARRSITTEGPTVEDAAMRATGEQQGASRDADEPCIRDSSGTMARVRIAHVSAKNSRTPCVRRRPSRCADHRSPARWLPPAPGSGSSIERAARLAGSRVAGANIRITINVATSM